MNYLETEKVIPQFIPIFKEMFKYNDDYNHLGAFFAKFPDYNKIELVSIDENIVLWSFPYYDRLAGEQSNFYFYSDLEGKVLFDNKLFAYATPFSNGSALVCNDSSDKVYVINLNSREMILLPNLNFDDFTDFRNNSLAVCDSETDKWGVYAFDYTKRDWQLDIPFIWDFVSLSRDSNLVYVGLNDSTCYYPNWEIGPYNHMIPDRYESVSIEFYKVALLKKNEAKTLVAFQELEKYVDNYLWARGTRTRFIPNCESNIGDKYFNETSSNTGLIVDPGSLNDYAMVLSRKK